MVSKYLPPHALVLATESIDSVTSSVYAPFSKSRERKPLKPTDYLSVNTLPPEEDRLATVKASYAKQLANLKSQQAKEAEKERFLRGLLGP